MSLLRNRLGGEWGILLLGTFLFPQLTSRADTEKWAFSQDIPFSCSFFTMCCGTLRPPTFWSNAMELSGSQHSAPVLQNAQAPNIPSSSPVLGMRDPLYVSVHLCLIIIHRDEVLDGSHVLFHEGYLYSSVPLIPCSFHLMLPLPGWMNTLSCRFYLYRGMEPPVRWGAGGVYTGIPCPALRCSCLSGSANWCLTTSPSGQKMK